MRRCWHFGERRRKLALLNRNSMGVRGNARISGALKTPVVGRVGACITARGYYSADLVTHRTLLTATQHSLILHAGSAQARKKGSFVKSADGWHAEEAGCSYL